MGKRILIIEDDPEMRKILTTIARKENYEWVEANNAINALYLLKTRSFDLVICDEYLPGLAGHEIAKWINQTNDHKNIPVILISGRDNSPLLSELSGRNLIFSFFPKPFAVNQLKNMIWLALNSNFHQK